MSTSRRMGRLRVNAESLDSDTILSPRKANNKRSGDVLEGPGPKALTPRRSPRNTLDLTPVSPGSKENDQSLIENLTVPSVPFPKRKKKEAGPSAGSNSSLSQPEPVTRATPASVPATSLLLDADQTVLAPRILSQPDPLPVSEQLSQPEPKPVSKCRSPKRRAPEPELSKPVSTPQPEPRIQGPGPQPSKRAKLRVPRKGESTPVPHPELKQHQLIRQDLEYEHQSSGIIKSIKLYNFMCHESFSLDWHENLNFVTGENGSGKSALLSGLIVGLGARALSTSRTKSIKSLIKVGCDSAKIEVTLLNNGDLNTEKYGREIMIQRVIDRGGSSIYKIDDGISRKMRPLRRTELDHILRTFCIMLENPVTILNQETARSFLKTKDPKDKYQLFYKGTNLEDCTEFLRVVNENIKEGADNLRKVKEILLEYKTDVLNLQKQKDKFDELDSMGEKVTQLNLLYHWSIVGVDETKRNDLMANLENLATKIEKLEEKIKDLIEGKRKYEEEGEGSPEEKAALLEKLRGCGKTEQEVLKKLGSINKLVSEAKLTYRQSTSKESQLQKGIQVLESKIEDLTTRGAAEAEEARREYEERKEILTGELEEAVQIFTALQEDMKQFRHGSDNLKQELHQLEDQSREFRTRKSRIQEELRSLAQDNAAQNRYAAFGKPMEELMAMIHANQHRFRKIPHGPFGACVIAKSEKWVKLIEFVLKDKMLDFVVDNAEDAILLNQFIKQTFLRGPTMGQRERRRPTVMVQRFRDQIYDVSSLKASTRNHPTVFDMIEPVNNDPVVMNALIDTTFMERVLLFDTRAEASELLKERNHPNFPRTCHLGYSLDEVGFRITPDPRYRMDPIHLGRFRGGMLRCSNAIQLRMLKHQVAELDSQLQALAPELDEKRQAETEFRAKFVQQEQLVNKAKTKVRELKLEIDSLTRQVQNVKDPDIASFAEELGEKKEELVNVISAKEQSKERIQELSPEIATLQRQKEDVAQQIEALKADLSTYDDRREENEIKIRKIETALTKIKTQLRSMEHDSSSLKRKLEEVTASLERHTEEAEAIGEKVETDRTPEDIQREVTIFSEELRKAREHAGDKERVVRQLGSAKQKFMDLNQHYSGVCAVYKLCKQLGYFATHRFEKLKESMSNAVMGCFHGLIASRGYKGRLLLCHEKKELYYFIYPDSEANEKTTEVLSGQNPKTIRNYLIEYASGLSGGERSFSTICFIISLWQVMESPFYMLDEFDVFMDAFNRKASQNALISHALCHKGNQFFFFTPLELTEMPKNADALITRMFPPVRTDDTLPGDASDAEDMDNSPPTATTSKSRRPPQSGGRKK